MNRFRNLFTIFAFSLLILALPSIGSAQWRNDRNDDYYGNGNYNRNLQATIKNLKNRARNFERRLDRELDNSRYDGRNREDRVNDLAEEFVGATEELSDEYDNRNDYNRTQDEARRVLQLGSELDRAVSRLRLSGNIQSEWNRIRQDLNVLSNAYNTNYNRRNRNGDRRRDRDRDDDDDYYNRNRNRRTNDNWRNRIPFPLPF